MEQGSQWHQFSSDIQGDQKVIQGVTKKIHIKNLPI